MSEKNIIKYEGELKLNGVSNIPCYVLEDGTRVIAARAMQNALEVTSKHYKTEEQKPGGDLGRFLSSKWFKSLINSEYELEHFEPVVCYKGGQKINGYEATTLVDVCNVMLDARKNGHIKTERQGIVAKQAEILIRSFAKIGIIALVDEATGYQYEREEDALQSILKGLIDDEINPRKDTFPLSFYKEIFKLWNIPFTEKNIKRKPQFIGHVTNRYVYLNMPAGTYVLDKLKKKTPKTDAGNYKFRFHQSLTPEKGWELLKKVINTVEAFASISDTKDRFKFYINEKYGQKSLFSEDEMDRLAKENDDVKPNIVKPKEPLSDFNTKLNTALNYNPKKDKKDGDEDDDLEAGVVALK
jgi:hypothetical protein